VGEQPGLTVRNHSSSAILTIDVNYLKEFPTDAAARPLVCGAAVGETAAGIQGRRLQGRWVLKEWAAMWQIDPVPASVLALGLAALWGASGVHKLLDPGAFAGALAAYALLPPRTVDFVARVLPLMEITVATGLLLPVSREAAALVSTLLLALYAVAIAINLRRGRRALDCGCFGFGHRSTISMTLLWRNGALVLASLAAGLLPRRVRALDWIDLFTVVIGVAAVALLYAAAEGLAAAARRLPRQPVEATRG
jgi:uncharacterized membrane protein YphA (DoxX/SURF4 family)